VNVPSGLTRLRPSLAVSTAWCRSSIWRLTRNRSTALATRFARLCTVRCRCLFEVVVDPGRGGVARDLLVVLSRKEDERERRVFLADRFEELDPVPSGHIVVGDHAVEPVVGGHLEPVGCARRRFDLEPLVFPFE